MDKTQFVRIAPGEMLSEEPEPPENARTNRRPLMLAVVLGLLAGALLLLVMVGLSRARH